MHYVVCDTLTDLAQDIVSPERMYIHLYKCVYDYNVAVTTVLTEQEISCVSVDSVL